MNTATRARKKRCDRNHVLYQATAPDGNVYVGLTVCDMTPMKSVRRRWLKHVNRAVNEDKGWGLCNAIREWGGDSFELKVLDKVRGKAAAYAREVELIRSINPSLNTARTGKK